MFEVLVVTEVKYFFGVWYRVIIIIGVVVVVGVGIRVGLVFLFRWVDELVYVFLGCFYVIF